MRFYTKWWRFTSLRDLQAIVLACRGLEPDRAPPSCRTGGPTTWSPVPRGVLVIDFLLTLTLIGGARFAVRSVIERPPRSELVSRGRARCSICGAGDAGNTLLRR